MIFEDLMNYCKAEAIASLVDPTYESIYRYLCREYSTKFHTPLDQVFKLDPEFVMLHVWESRYEKMDLDDELENILDTIYTMQDPEYSKAKADEQQAFDEQAEKEEEERIASGESLTAHLKKNQKKNSKGKNKDIEKVPSPGLPKSGGIDMEKLKHLEKEEKEGGFKD